MDKYVLPFLLGQLGASTRGPRVGPVLLMFLHTCLPRRDPLLISMPSMTNPLFTDHGARVDGSGPCTPFPLVCSACTWLLAWAGLGAPAWQGTQTGPGVSAAQSGGRSPPCDTRSQLGQAPVQITVAIQRPFRHRGQKTLAGWGRGRQRGCCLMDQESQVFKANGAGS